MKHTKLFMIALFIFSVFIYSCSKDELMVENSESTIKTSQKSGDIANSSYIDSLPKIKFIPKGEGENIYTIVLKDPNQTTPVRFDGRIRYQDQSLQSTNEGSYEVIFSIEEFETVGRAKNIDFPAPVENQILDVFLEYREGDVVVKTFEYNLFVSANGTTDLQKPALKKIEWTWNDGGITMEDSWEQPLSIVIENDPAEVVAAVEVVFDEKTSLPAPNSYTNYLKTRVKYGQCWVFSGIITYAENPQGQSYTVTVSLLDKSGIVINEPVTLTTKPIPSKDKPSIHNIYIRELKDTNGSLTHEIAGLVLNIKPQRLDYVEITFTEPLIDPKPLTIIWRMRKKPEILYSSWDNVINDYVSEIQNNPLCVGSDQTVVNPLFGKSAAGYTYAVSAAMFDKNGKQIGNPQTISVTVTGETQNSEPVLQSTRLFSTDGGKTWNYEAIIQDNGQDIEKIQVEFVTPYEGPEPVLKLIDLYLVGEKEDNVKIYSGSAQFKGTPTEGNSYSTNLNLYRKGYDSSTKILTVTVCHL